MATDHVVTWGQTSVGVGGDEIAGVGVGLGEVEGQGDARKHVQQVWVGRCYAGGVEEGGDGTYGRGHGGAVGQVAGVVLRTASNGDVLESEAFCDSGKGSWCCSCVSALVLFFVLVQFYVVMKSETYCQLVVLRLTYRRLGRQTFACPR